MASEKEPGRSPHQGGANPITEPSASAGRHGLGLAADSASFSSPAAPSLADTVSLELDPTPPVMPEQSAAGKTRQVVDSSLADTITPAGLTAAAPPTRPSRGAPTPTTRGDHRLPADISRGSNIDRFIVVDLLGAGGMGVVVSAYDPELDRKVAIKVLRNDIFPSGRHTAGRQRLLREARAMAKLDHPNVVTVYEIGTVKNRVFVAMEYIDGDTATRWLAADKRSWREIVAIFALAGRGLAAAHDADLVHRDFKPDNVMVGKDGRVWVTDFGLVSATGKQVDRGDLTTAIPAQDLDLSLTRTGAVLGTPVYMAPEQHDGKPAEPRTDQFAFCVALYEGLYGQRPFAGANYEEIAATVTRGEVREAARNKSVPTWLRAVLLRGLRPDPGARYPSMAALLTALHSDPAARRRRALTIGALATAFLALAAVTAVAIVHSTQSRGRLCSGAANEIVYVWSDASKDRVDAAFAATELPYAMGSLASVHTLIDNYADEWAAMRTSACEATHMRGTQSAEILDLRMSCLDDRLAELAATVDLFADADAAIVEKAVSSTSALSPLAGCADVSALRGQTPIPASVDPAEIDALRARIAQAWVFYRSGKYKDGLEAARAATASAGELGYRPLEADALRVYGALQMRTAGPKSAVQIIVDAHIAGLAGGNDEAAIRAALQLVYAIGYRLGDYEQGAQWGRVAAALIEHSNIQGPAGELASNLTILEIVKGNYDLALTHGEHAVALRSQQLGPDHPTTASAYLNLGVAYKKLGDYDQALYAYGRTLEIYRSAFGANHPNTAMAMHNIGVVYKRKGQHRQAEEQLVAALSIWEQVLPAGHPNIAMALFNLGAVQVDLGEIATAEANLIRARELKADKLGADHPSVAKVTLALAGAARARGDHRRALSIIEPVITALERRLGTDHPLVATTLREAGLTRLELGDVTGARSAFIRALEIRDARLPADHPDVAASLTDLGRAELAGKHPELALAPLTRAADIYATAHATPADIANTRFLLARASWDGGEDRAAARKLAEQALTAYDDDEHSARRGEIMRWLDETAPAR